MNPQQLLKDFEDWFWSLKNQVKEGGRPGIIANLLQVLEDLKVEFDLEYSHYPTEDGTQIKGVGASKLKKVLALFGEHRVFLKEGGRTSRGGPPAVEKMLGFLKSQFPEMPDEQLRKEAIIGFQGFLVERVREIHNRQKVKLIFNPTLSTWQIIHNLLQEAINEGKKSGHIAQHLVGAKLQLRFPDISVSNESTSTADKPTNRAGDFHIGNTVFHVTISPAQAVFEKCQQNIKEGLKVYLIVPDSKLVGTRQQAEQFSNGEIAIESIESFISQNIEEISMFASDQLKHSIVSLIRLYNKRVDAVEVDKSLMIELPSNLEKING